MLESCSSALPEKLRLRPFLVDEGRQAVNCGACGGVPEECWRGRLTAI